MRASAYPLIVVFFLCRPARADTLPVQPIPPGEDKIVVLREGQPAPFTGQLFDNPTALRWANFLKQYRERLALDATYQQALCAASLEASGKRLSLCEEKYQSVVSSLEKDLSVARKELLNPPFYRTVWFGVACGVLVTAVTVSATVAIVGSLR